MKHTKSPKTFSNVSKSLHWLIAFIVISMLSFGFFMSGLADAQKPMVYMLHKSFGLSVLALMIVRVIWIHHAGRPALPTDTPRWEIVLSRGVQYCLYIALLMMPLCGWVMSTASGRIPLFFGLFPLPCPGIEPNQALADIMDTMHKTTAWVLIGLIGLHVAGALKHHFINKDQVLGNMWFLRKK
jgi:cytochrome b561